MRKLALVACAILILVVAYFATRNANTEAPATREDSVAAPDDVANAPLEAQSNSTSSGERVESPTTAVDATKDDSAASSMFVIHGRTVDARRFALAGITVELILGDGPALTASSDISGVFRFEFDETTDRSGRALVWAHDARALAGIKDVWMPSAGNSKSALGYTTPNDSREVDVGGVALLPAAPLAVVVTASDVPVSSATVELQLGSFAQTFARRTTLANGAITFPPVPRGELRVSARHDGRSGSAVAFSPEEREARIDLSPPRELEVLVVDAVSRAPIAGAQIQLDETVRLSASGDPDLSRGMSMGGEVYTSLELARATTDARGSARLRFRNSERIRLSVTALDYDSYPSKLKRAGAAPDLNSGFAEIELSPLPARTVRWPIVAGEVPIPADGTALELRPAPGSGLPGQKLDWPTRGRMDVALAVVERNPRFAQYLATTPDGSITRLHVPQDGELGPEVSFRRPRQIEVIVRDAAGGPATGAFAIARNQGNNPLCGWSTTDAEGRALLTGLYGELCDVYVAAPGAQGGGVRCGAVDLEQGDGRIEATLPSESTVRLRTWIDGIAQLPPKYVIRTVSGATTVLEEFPERGELRVRLEVNSNISEVTLGMLALGFSRTSVTLQPSTDGTEPVFDVPLERSARLIVRITGSSLKKQIGVERFDANNGVWGSAGQQFQPLSAPNGAFGAFVFEGLSPGRYRATDSVSKQHSSEVELGGSVLEAHVDLDVVALEMISGRIAAPADTNFALVRILSDDAQLGEPQKFGTRAGSVPSGARIGSDGTFEFQAPSNQDIRLRVWHPFLSPAVEGGSETVRAPQTGVILRLERADFVRIPLTSSAGPLPSSVRVAASRGEVSNTPEVWLHAQVQNDEALFTGLAPGRWTIWLDPEGSLAPATVRDVEVTSGETLAPRVEFTRGLELRVKVLVQDGQSTPRIFANATSKSGPSYYRNVNSNGEAEVVLAGLAPGTIEVSMSAIMDMKSARRSTITLTGPGATTLEFDLR